MALRPHSVTLRLVTPLFLGGFEGRKRDPDFDDDDIRKRVEADGGHFHVDPLVRVWRHWFRMLLGGLIGTDREPLKEIRKREYELFGGIAAGSDRGQPSRVRVSLVRPTGGFETEKVPDALKYLAFGLKEQESNGVVEAVERWALKPGQTFTVDVVCNDGDWKLLEPVIRFWSELGGLGARFRKGWGSFDLVNDRTNDLPVSLAVERHRFAAAVNVRTIETMTRPTFDVVHPEHCAFTRVSQLFTTWELALRAIQNQLRFGSPRFGEVRSHLADRDFAATIRPVQEVGPVLSEDGSGWRLRWRDGDARVFRLEKKVSRHGQPYAIYLGRDHDVIGSRLIDPRTREFRAPSPTLNDNVVNAGFGLPIPMGRNWGNAVVTARWNGQELRRPSPISFRVHSSSNGEYYVVVTWFKSVFLPGSDSDWTIVVDGAELPLKQADVDADLDAFFRACDGTLVEIA